MLKTNEKASQVILEMFNGSEDARPVVFIGAGLSCPPYLLWNELIEHLAEITNYIEKEKLKGNPLKATQALQKYNPEGFREALVEMFSKDPDDCSPALREVVRINFKAFLTTNFDRSIETAFAFEDRACPGYYSSDSNSRLLSSLCRSQNLFYLHGRVDRNPSQRLEIVFTEDEYDQAYFRHNGHVGTFLFDVFSQNSVIFTGFSLNKHEPVNYVLQAILRIKEKFNITNISQDWKILLPNGEKRDPEFSDQLEQAKVGTILFDKVDASFSGLRLVWKKVADTLRWERRREIPCSLNPITKPNSGEGYV